VRGAEASALEAWLARARSWADAQLERHFAAGPAAAAPPAGDLAPGDGVLAEAMRYAVLGEGKRLRPSLALLVCESLGGEAAAVELPAVAVELVHAYSLVHDDLPCMDDDDLRRGRPTCHVRFGEAQAVLAGDALLTKAFEVLSRGPGELALEWIRVLARAAGDAGMVGGQSSDLALARGSTAELVRAMHARKTAALIGAAGELGAVSAGAGTRERDLVRRFARALGLLFQATDDLLDATGDTATLGKTAGIDDKNQRATLVAALGIQGTEREADRLAGEARAAALELGWGAAHVAQSLVAGIRRRGA
jgi:geranylgeranyl pyrophosphate synthase